MNEPGATADPGLIFNWEAPRRRLLTIGAFIIASLLLHATAFYLFQIVYPPAVVLLPPPARVNLITPESEEGRSLLRWIDAEDPALASATQRPPEARQRALPRVQHLPSYLVEEPKLKQAPAYVPPTAAPESQPPGPVEISQRKPVEPTGVVPTRIEVSEELRPLGAIVLPPPTFTGSNKEAPEAVRFRVAVSGHGEIRYSFPLNSSGDVALDEQARRYLALARFPGAAKSVTADNSLLWGIASVTWGNDVAAPEDSKKDKNLP